MKKLMSILLFFVFISLMPTALMASGLPETKHLDRIDDIEAGTVDTDENRNSPTNTGDDQRRDSILLDPKLSNEEIELAKQKEAAAARSTRGLGQMVILPVTPRIQKFDWYCGPASVQTVVAYHSAATCKSQGTYRVMLGATQENGTTFPNVKTVLNNELNHISRNYVYVPIGTILEWRSKILYSIDTRNLSVLDINTMNNDNFPYHVTGHIVVTSGYDYRSGVVSRVQLADPHYQYGGANWHLASKLYQANNNHFRQAMIY